jgi:tetratricopeptide (TPR) repeat protein
MERLRNGVPPWLISTSTLSKAPEIFRKGAPRIMISSTYFSFLRLYGKLVLALVLACGLYADNVFSQTDRFLKPPRKDLVTLRFPALTNLEESVRTQITETQKALAGAINDPNVTETALMEAYGNLGQIYHAYSFVPEARDCYINANVLAPKDFRWIYLTADLDHQTGRMEDAIGRYRVARTLRPDYIAVSVNLGNVFLDLNRLDEAKESFTAALEVDQNNPAAHYGLGEIALSERNYSEAVNHFNQTLAQLPGANRVHYSLAMAYRGLGDRERVKAHLAQQGPVGVRASDPLLDGLQDLIAGERVHLARGKLAFEAKRYAEAAAEFREAVESKPGSVAARVNLGAALTQLGDAPGAIEQFEEAIHIDPRNVNANYNLAILLAGQNKHEKAIAHLQTALTVEPGDSGIRFLLGKELVKLERLDEAMVEFSRVVQMNPNNESALLEQVKLLYRKGQFKEALELARRLYDATRAPQHGALVARALAELGRCSEARDWQRRMIAVAEEQNNIELLPKLRSTLKLYEQSPCRPPNDASLIQEMQYVL